MRHGLGFHNRHSAGGFQPISLFTGGVQGAWYDPSDFGASGTGGVGTLFQDSAGTTPVTAVEQAVGLMLDKSGRGNHAFQSTSASRPTLRARYNLLTRSEEFNDAAWTKLNGSITATNITDPFGGLTADEYTAAASVSSGKEWFQNVTIVSGATYTMSVYAKKKTHDFIQLRHYTAVGGVTRFANFDIAAGQVGTVGADATASISDAKNGWWRCVMTATVTGTAGGVDMYLAPSASASSAPSWTSNGTEAAYIWGAQLVPTAVFPSNTYQRVGAATDYATGTAFPPYLFFDGLDDSMLTNSVDFATVTSDGLARRNLLLNPTQFDASTWTKTRSSVTANATAAPDGTTTADKLVEDTSAGTHLARQDVTVANAAHVFSVYAKASERSVIELTPDGGSNTRWFDLANGTTGGSGGGSSTIENVGNGWYRCSYTRTLAAGTAACFVYLATSPGTTSYTGNGTSGLFLWGAQLETGSTATAFQNIGTDRMLVVAGVTKNSDAARGIVVELSPTAVTNNGSFNMNAPYAAAANYAVASRGTNTVDAVAATYTSPITNVLTQSCDISLDSLILRVNGAQAATSAVDQGTGNYGNYPLFIGRRNNASLPLNGNLYSLVIAGAAYTAGQISSTESYVAAKTPLGTI